MGLVGVRPLVREPYIGLAAFACQVDFREGLTGEVPKIALPRTRVNKGKSYATIRPLLCLV